LGSDHRVVLGDLVDPQTAGGGRGLAPRGRRGYAVGMTRRHKVLFTAAGLFLAAGAAGWFWFVWSSRMEARLHGRWECRHANSDYSTWQFLPDGRCHYHKVFAEPDAHGAKTERFFDGFYRLSGSDLIFDAEPVRWRRAARPVLALVGLGGQWRPFTVCVDLLTEDQFQSAEPSSDERVIWTRRLGN
jgi:hypothetical protein